MTLTNLIQLADKKQNMGLSINVDQAIKVLNENGYEAIKTVYSGYRDIKVPGRAYVTSRKTVNYYSLLIKKDSTVLLSLDTERNMYVSYTFTAFIARLK